MRVFRVAVVAAVLVAGLFFVALALFRGSFFDLYANRLDAWVRAGGSPATIQSEVIGECGQLVMSQSGALQIIKFLTWRRDDFDYYVDLCAKMTVNRVHPQPEFAKRDLLNAYCGPASEPFFQKLCKRSGLTG